MITFSLVDVKSITSNVPRSNFTEADLDNLADMILESGGLIKPLLVKVTGAESYTVVDGHLEYYAAVRAKEKNARQGEMVNAFVISTKIEDIVAKQAAALRGVTSPEKQVKTSSETTTLESRLTNIELRLEKQNNESRVEWTREIQKLENRLKEIETNIPQRIKALEALNNLSQDQLAIELQRSRIPSAQKIAQAIADSRQNKPQQKFDDYRDVVKSVKGLGDKTLLSIIDSWS